MSSGDEIEEMLLKRKLLELMKKQQQKKDEDDPVKLVKSYLYDRGDEVLDAALSQFPKETNLFVKKLAELIKKGVIREKISGSELLYILRNIGIPVSLETKITILKDGISLSLSDMLKEKD
ncbi:MAG: double-stranded DNA-binding protein [Thaumarchaeota archaeon]|jgi:DNA-binding TFAR19-related protein (PDSD5 family)|nr:double-stranded DNA-binding protein [Nitrososphaerota archaeon]